MQEASNVGNYPVQLSLFSSVGLMSLFDPVELSPQSGDIASPVQSLSPVEPEVPPLIDDKLFILIVSSLNLSKRVDFNFFIIIKLSCCLL